MPPQITFFFGTLLNEAINAILKQVIREERPTERESLYSEYGMPSSHSQFMWFFTAYIAYFIFIRYTFTFITCIKVVFVLSFRFRFRLIWATDEFARLHHINNNSILSRIWIGGVLGGVVASAVAVSVGRVYLMYHSWGQVAVGALVGAALATLWFALTHCILTPLFPQVVCW